MQRRAHWQFSIRTLIVLMLVIGPVAGGLCGTFGVAIQELFVMMTVWLFTSVILAIISMILACVIVSPLLIVDRMVRKGNHHSGSQHPAEVPPKQKME